MPLDFDGDGDGDGDGGAVGPKRRISLRLTKHWKTIFQLRMSPCPSRNMEPFVELLCRDQHCMIISIPIPIPIPIPIVSSREIFRDNEFILYRIVVFKKGIEKFKKVARDNR